MPLAVSCRMAGGGCDSGNGGMSAAAEAGTAESFPNICGRGTRRRRSIRTAGSPPVRSEGGAETDGPGAGLRAVLAERFSARGPAGFSGAASGRSGLGEAGQTDAAGAGGRLRMPGRPQHVSGEQGGPPCRLLRIRERPDGRERGGDFGKIKEKIFFLVKNLDLEKFLLPLHSQCLFSSVGRARHS